VGTRIVVGGELPMRANIKLTTRVLMLVFALILVGIFFAPGTSTTPAGPYQSALSNVGVGTAWAAKPGSGPCNGAICEFIAPGYHCLFEGGPKEGCTRLSTGGCTTISCP